VGVDVAGEGDPPVAGLDGVVVLALFLLAVVELLVVVVLISTNCQRVKL